VVAAHRSRRHFFSQAPANGIDVEIDTPQAALLRLSDLDEIAVRIAHVTITTEPLELYR
jgi:hypothetical protein